MFAKLLVQKHHIILTAIYLGKGRARSFVRSIINDLKVISDLSEEYREYRAYSMAQWAEYIRHDHRGFLRRCSKTMHSTPATLAHIPISDSSHIPVSET